MPRRRPPRSRGVGYSVGVPPAAQLDALHLTPRLGRLGGGVFQFALDLAAAQAKVGMRVALIGLGDAADLSDWPGLGDSPAVEVHPIAYEGGPLRRVKFTVGHARGLERGARELASRARVIHAHAGVRMWTLTAARRAARANRRPLMLAPAGSFYPWLLGRNRARKVVGRALFDRLNLPALDALHVTCDEEARYCRLAGLTQPAHVLPPGVAPPPEGDAGRFLERHPELRGRRIITFLGLFDRKKGLIRLLRAWAAAQVGGEWRLVLAGPDVDGHAAEVRREADRLGLSGRVVFAGAQFGTAKGDLLAASELLVLPTDWENFGIVVGEALAVGVPVLTTTHTPWSWLPRERAGWHVDATPDAVAAALRQAVALPPEELRAMGDRGRAVVRRDYAWPVAAERVGRVYDELVENHGR